MNDDKEWLEDFYSDLEKNLTNYTRPSDWLDRLERTKRIHAKKVRHQEEGKTKGVFPWE